MKNPEPAHSLDVYCGECAACRELDAWLATHPGDRMPWPAQELKSDIPSTWRYR